MDSLQSGLCRASDGLGAQEPVPPRPRGGAECRWWGRCGSIDCVRQGARNGAPCQRAAPPGAERATASADFGNGLRGATLRQLRAFSIVSRHHSFVRAAAELCLTPPAVSLQIKELEHAIGMPLFERKGKAVALTHAAERLLPDVHRALSALLDAEDTLVRLRGEQTQRVSIGMVSNALYFLPRLLSRYRAEHARVDWQLSLGNREELVDRVRRGLVDFAVMGAPPTQLAVQAEAFAYQPLVIVAAPGHGLSGQRSIPVGALAQQTFVVREPGSGTRAAMERFFRNQGMAPTRLIELGGNEAIKQAVMAQMGLGFVSLHSVGLELTSGLLVALDVVGLPLVRRWFVVHLDAAPLGEAALDLRRFIIEQGSGWLAAQFGPLALPPAG